MRYVSEFMENSGPVTGQASYHTDAPPSAHPDRGDEAYRDADPSDATEYHQALQILHDRGFTNLGMHIDRIVNSLMSCDRSPGLPASRDARADRAGGERAPFGGAHPDDAPARTTVDRGATQPDGDEALWIATEAVLDVVDGLRQLRTKHAAIRQALADAIDATDAANENLVKLILRANLATRRLARARSIAGQQRNSRSPS